jgi:hypothetical protein
VAHNQGRLRLGREVLFKTVAQTQVKLCRRLVKH